MDPLPTDKKAGDIARDVARAIVSLMPGGGAIQVLLESVFSSPVEKRKEEWMRDLADAITRVQQIIGDLTPEKLAENEAFITVALQASQIAIRNHQKSKLEALRNAVINSALPSSLDEDEQMAFVYLVDRFTPSHLRLLELLNHPGKWISKNNLQAPNGPMSSVWSVIAHYMPEFIVREDTVDLLISDLQAGGVIQRRLSVRAEIEGSGTLDPRTTSYGERFMRFITMP